MSYLTNLGTLEADHGGGSQYVKFTNPGQTVAGRFQGRQSVQTKLGAAKKLTMEVVETNISGLNPGPAVVFESTHISQILDRENLQPGQGFALQLCNIDRRTRFKQFGFRRVSELDQPDQHV